MSKQYVYVIGNSDPFGTFNTMATLDRSSLPALIHKWYEKFTEDTKDIVSKLTAAGIKTADNERLTLDEHMQESMPKLTELLELTDGILANSDGSGDKLSDRDGGLQLFVIELQ